MRRTSSGSPVWAETTMVTSGNTRNGAEAAIVLTLSAGCCKTLGRCRHGQQDRQREQRLCPAQIVHRSGLGVAQSDVLYNYSFYAGGYGYDFQRFVKSGSALCLASKLRHLLLW